MITRLASIHEKKKGKRERKKKEKDNKSNRKKKEKENKSNNLENNT